LKGGIYIRGVILAAGSGERARPLTEVLPKALVNIAGKALLDRTLYGLSCAGIQDVTVAIGFKASMIESHLKSREHEIDEGLDIHAVTVQDYGLGPLRTILTAISSFTDNEFLISPADAVVSPDIISGMINQYSKNPKNMMLAVDFAAESGTPVSVNKEGRIVGLGEPSPAGEISTGRSAMLLIADRTIVRYCQTALARGESRLVSVLNAMIYDGVPIYCYNVQGEWFDVDSLSDILRINRYFLAKPDVRDTEKCIFIPHGDLMEIGDSLTMKNSDIMIDRGVLLRGPVLLSTGTRIAEKCRIGPNVTIGSFVRIAGNCEIIDALVQDNSVVQAGSRIQNSIVCGAQTYHVEM
jgi:mannose-1-phosphate guanylyltransferase